MWMAGQCMSERGGQSFEHERKAIRLEGGQKGTAGQGRGRSSKAAGKGVATGQWGGRATQQGGATRQQLPAWYIAGIAFHGVPWALW